MMHHSLLAPFADAARQAQYEAVRTALAAAATAGGPATVLLGNLAALPEGLAVDALVVQPHRATVLLLVPQGGQLRVPALAHGAWALDGHPLAGRGGTDNPYAQYQQQKAAVAAWLGPQLGRGPDELLPVAGAVVFETPVTFGNEAEQHLRKTAGDFQLVRGAQQLPRRLRPVGAGARVLAPGVLRAFAERWPDAAVPDDSGPEPEPAEVNPLSFWKRKAGQLWQWLGAADVPADPPYGGDAALAEREQLRQELPAELRQHQRAAARRQAAHEQDLARLRAQLARPAAPAQAEQPQTTVLEAAWRAEAAARNQALDARIQQLGQLIDQLRTQAAAPGRSEPARALPARAPAATGRRRKPWRVVQPQDVTRLAAGLAVAAGLGVGGWSLWHGWAPVRVVAPHPVQMAAEPTNNPAEDQEAFPLPDSAQAPVFTPANALPDAAETTTPTNSSPANDSSHTAAPAPIARPDSSASAPASAPAVDSLRGDD